MKNSINQKTFHNLFGEKIYVDLTRLTMSTIPPENNTNNTVTVYVHDHLNPDLLAIYVAQMEHLIATYWMLTRLKNYDSSTASQTRKVGEVAACEDEIRLHAQLFKLT